MNSMCKPQQKVLTLPRGYLSPSAIDTWKRDPEKYIRHYFYGEPNTFENDSTRFGTMFDDARAGDRKHDDPIIEMLLNTLPALGKPKITITASLPSKFGNIPLLGELDDYNPKTHDFDEYKTGMRKWTQNLANKQHQILFYQLMLWLNHDVLDNKKSLIWVETKRDDRGDICPTGKVMTFPVEVTLTQLLKFSREIINVAHEISEFYKDTINKTVL
mgnify:CR=1 FL=1